MRTARLGEYGYVDPQLSGALEGLGLVHSYRENQRTARDIGSFVALRYVVLWAKTGVTILGVAFAADRGNRGGHWAKACPIRRLQNLRSGNKLEPMCAEHGTDLRSGSPANPTRWPTTNHPPHLVSRNCIIRSSHFGFSSRTAGNPHQPRPRARTHAAVMHLVQVLASWCYYVSWEPSKR